jgi:hypothetical protein
LCSSTRVTRPGEVTSAPSAHRWDRNSRSIRDASRVVQDWAELCFFVPLTGQYGKAKAEVAGGAGRRRLRPQVTKPRGLNNLSFSSRFLLSSSELRDNSLGTIRPHPPKMARNWPVNVHSCASDFGVGFGQTKPNILIVQALKTIWFAPAIRVPVEIRLIGMLPIRSQAFSVWSADAENSHAPFGYSLPAAATGEPFFPGDFPLRSVASRCAGRLWG